MRKTLWTRNFTLVTLASALGAMGGIAGGFALSFLVFDETGSTLAAALVVAMNVIPGFLLPLVVAPWMDRLPRKPVLVAGDLINGILYGLTGLYLLRFQFSYGGYLLFSLLLSSLECLDMLAYNSIYPKLIPAGQEEKGYTVAGMLYPVLKVVMTPVAAILLDAVGVGWILIIQAGFSLLAALTESRIRLWEENRMEGERAGLSLWWRDVKEATRYLREERGLRSIYSYMAATSGVAAGYGPLVVAFFRTAPGLTTAMYAMFSVAEFLGRSLGGVFHYHVEIPARRKFSFAFLVYQIYEMMDMCLLWLPYPLMLVNRGICGFLGMNSGTMRQAAVQQYIPDTLRARVNAFESMLLYGATSVLSLAVGALGELIDYRLCVTVAAGATLAVCWATIWRNRRAVRAVYETKRS